MKTPTLFTCHGLEWQRLTFYVSCWEENVRRRKLYFDVLCCIDLASHVTVAHLTRQGRGQRGEKGRSDGMYFRRVTTANDVENVPGARSRCYRPREARDGTHLLYPGESCAERGERWVLNGADIGAELVEDFQGPSIQQNRGKLDHLWGSKSVPKNKKKQRKE